MNPSTQQGSADVIVVGAGVAGLTAADALRDLRVAIVEADGRVGGRLHSASTGDAWLNWGAHMVGGDGSAAGDLAARLGVPLTRIDRRLVGLVCGRRRLLRMPSALYPLAMALSARERLALVRVGLALRAGAWKANQASGANRGESEIERRRRRRAFEAHRSLMSYLGPMSPAVASFVRTITERTGADPEEMSAGHGLRSFANVWSKAAPGFNVIGGAARLAEALAADLPAEIHLDTAALRVEQRADGAAVHVYGPRGAEELRAQAVILAIPPPAAAPLIEDAPIAFRRALTSQCWGPFLTAAATIDAGAARPWSTNYAILTPGCAFSTIFGFGAHAATGNAPSSIMMFRGARGAVRLLQESDTTLVTFFRSDLEKLFPETRGAVGDIVVRRWEVGAPYLAPGAAAACALLDEPCGRIVLAGDHLEFPNIEAAMASASTAAAAARRLVRSPTA